MGTGKTSIPPQLACDVCDFDLIANSLLIPYTNENYRIPNVKPELTKYHPDAWIIDYLDLNKVLGFENDSLQWGGTGFSKVVDAVVWKAPSTLVVYKTTGPPGNAVTVRREMDLRQYLLVVSGKLMVVTPYGSAINGITAGENIIEDRDNRTEEDLETLSMKANTGENLHSSQEVGQALGHQGFSGLVDDTTRSSTGTLINLINLIAEERLKLVSAECWPLGSAPGSSTGNVQVVESSEPFSNLNDVSTENPNDENACAVTCAEAREGDRSTAINLAWLELNRFVDKWSDFNDLHHDKSEDENEDDKIAHDCLSKLVKFYTRSVSVYKRRHDSPMATKLLRLNAVTAFLIFSDSSRSLPCPWDLYVQWLAFFIPLIARENPSVAALLHSCCYDMREIVRHHYPGFDELEFSLCPLDFGIMSRNWMKSSKKEQPPPCHRDLASYEVAREIRDTLLKSEGLVRSFRTDEGEMCLEFRRRKHIELVTVADKRDEFVARNAAREFARESGIAGSDRASGTPPQAKDSGIVPSESSSIDDARTLVIGSSDDKEVEGPGLSNEAAGTDLEGEEQKTVSSLIEPIDEVPKSNKRRSWWKKILAIVCRCG